MKSFFTTHFQQLQLESSLYLTVLLTSKANHYPIEIAQRAFVWNFMRTTKKARSDPAAFTKKSKCSINYCKLTVALYPSLSFPCFPHASEGGL